MKWKPVKGPGDTLRGISYPSEMPASAKLRMGSNPYVLYNEFDHMLSEAKGRMAWAAYNQANARGPHDARMNPQTTPTKRTPGLPWITHKRGKPNSILGWGAKP